VDKKRAREPSQLVHLFVHRGDAALRVGHFTVVGVTTSARSASGGAEDHGRRHSQADAPTIMRMTPTVESRNP
jgi:hypothetical protein